MLEWRLTLEYKMQRNKIHIQNIFPISLLLKLIFIIQVIEKYTFVLKNSSSIDQGSPLLLTSVSLLFLEVTTVISLVCICLC